MGELKTFLDRLYDRYHSPDYLVSDPLEFVHRYREPGDQEAVALVAALLAYGNVKQIRGALDVVLRRMHASAASPAAFVDRLKEPEFAALERPRWKGPLHRLNPGKDVLLLLRLLAESRARHGSLGAHLSKGLRADDRDFSGALDFLIEDWKRLARELGWPRGKSFFHLLNSPSGGSVCKRWSMLLRWMVRKDRLDPGLWAAQGRLGGEFALALRPDQLILPLDTHTGRITRYLGLTRRKTLNWKAAREITDALLVCDPADPVRYDFALSRLGILDLCQKKFRAEICEKCDLLPVCQYANRRRNKRFLTGIADACYAPKS